LRRSPYQRVTCPVIPQGLCHLFSIDKGGRSFVDIAASLRSEIDARPSG
jgi:hypothetical protein